MQKKYEYITRLAENTAKQLTNTEISWMEFLDFAAKLYKYPFSEQILIYAQRPDATACASLEQWNEIMHCWVNKGSKGIALIDEESDSGNGLKYVFDISDVHKARGIGRYPYLWIMREDHKGVVVNQLEKTYGSTNGTNIFEDRLIEIADHITEEFYDDIISQVNYVSEGRFFEKLDEQNAVLRIKETLSSNIAYMLLSRCGADMEKYRTALDFSHIHNFNTVETLSVIGSATTDLSKPILIEIGRAIRAYEREITVRDRQEGNFKEIILENESDMYYNALKRKSEMEPAQSEYSHVKRSDEYEVEIRGERGLPNTSDYVGRAAGGNTDQIRTPAQELSEGEQEGDLYGAVTEWKSHEPLAYAAGTSRRENGTSDRADESERGRDRAAQSNRSDVMGAEDEQHQTLSGGNRTDGTDIQLNTAGSEPGDDTSSGFSLTDYERGILRYDKFLIHKRPEIAGYLLTELDEAKQRDYLKRCYKLEEYTEFYIGIKKQRAGYRADTDGITMWMGNYLSRTAETRASWEEVRNKVCSFIEKGTYLAPRENISQEEYQQLSLFPSVEEQVEIILAAEASKKYTPPDIFSVQEQDVDLLRPYPETETAPAEKEILKIDKASAVNFRITYERSEQNSENKKLGFSPKEKYKQNIAAIRVLDQIESEHRLATTQEQEILSRYVGWGGLADVFDETKAGWANEYQELKSILSLEEYASARGSTLNAHYTSPAIIKGIYHVMDRMGFEKGNILEPAMGIGNFFGMLPEKMKASGLYGVELDSITGRIARQLYPHADIKIIGFEKTEFPNDFFDVAIGNIPFGQYKVADRVYDKHNFLIHDYFFAKTLEKVRPGGILAFITSKGTMDKQSPAVRKYLAQRAELLGAIRLPNNAFKENAGTEVTSDLIFLKKRDRIIDHEPDWVHLSENEDSIVMNDYFVEHPEMILGKMEMISGPYGMEATCTPDADIPFVEQLYNAVEQIKGTIDTIELDEFDDELARESLPADPNVQNYSYTIVGKRAYYRENSIMKPVEVSESMEQRIIRMVGLRECTQELIYLQLNDFPDSMIKSKQTELNKLYDVFSKEYGLINSQTNKRAFNQDSSYCLLCSLEKLDEEGNFNGKADMFTKRTIKKQVVVTQVDTASEALAVSLSEKAKVDLAFMASLTEKNEEDITKELAGVIFLNPVTDKWVTADEYLSGNVREKMEVAKTFAENNPTYGINVASLEKVQPKELDASEIEVRIGATWIAPEYLVDFMRETFETPNYLFDRNVVGVQYSDVTGQWNIKGKNADRGNALTNVTYGTGRKNAYEILEDSLNLRDSRIFDIVIEDGKEKRVLNKKETMLSSQKQEAIREVFKDWVFKEPVRRQTLCDKYNVLFNSTRPREYDGSHLKFPGMTPDIILKPHQKNAVAHVLYGDNTLLAHCVGAGKTFEMTAAAMESKRLGLCQKSLFVVPNHLTEQWASDFLRLYPGANILAATKKDFEPANRKKFCSRIATGDYDAVIIGHSQFEKIPLSTERQIAIVENQIREIEMAIEAVKDAKGERYTIKQMEKTKKSLSARLCRLNDATRKDNVVTFEQLGVDRLFVDESHNYKNLFLYTKMRNVAGIAQTEAQKSSDMFAKCQYLDELTGGKGITFATGTPISNSMTELYTNMRYLQYHTLQKMGLGHFDSWAAAFGETQTVIELAPEGTGYRAKTRFAKFFNLPELISLFKESADIQTPDMLNLPIPKAEYINEVLKPSDYQKDMVKSLAERAEKVRDRQVEPHVDNMLKITNDGRKLALDQRLINDMLPDEEQSKSSVCVENSYRIWEESKEDKSAQILFCDLSTPKGGGSFNVYENIRNKLIEKGVPKEDISFIHEANTEIRKAELFAKVRSGQVRFLLGSTQKMGAGTNVQDRLIALHHLDVPWRPSDIEQQEGRILRQGNLNPKVKIFRYVTEGTFDSYSWQLIENKQKFIGQIMTSKSPVRSCEDIDEAALTYAEVKALATGNPYIKEKMDLDIQVSRLKLLKANHTSQRYRLEDNIAKNYPQQITTLKERLAGYQLDIKTYQQNRPVDKDSFSMLIGGKTYNDKKEAGTALISICKEIKETNAAVAIGEYLGLKMNVVFDSFYAKYTVCLKGKLTHDVEVGSDPLGNVQRLNNALDSMANKESDLRQVLDNVEHQLDTAKMEVNKPFAQEIDLNEKISRLNELNAILNMDKTENFDVDIDVAEECNEESIISNLGSESIISKLNQKKQQVELYAPQLSKEKGMEKYC